jgi:hypothetical protein
LQTKCFAQTTEVRHGSHHGSSHHAVARTVFGGKTLLYIRFLPCETGGSMMAALDSNIWGFIAMPLGLLLCFGPGLFVWLKAELETPPPEKREDHP